MTDDRIALRALLDKGSDDDLLGEMVALVANRLMQFDVEKHCNAAPHERTEGGRTTATAIVIGAGKRAPGRWT